MRVSVLLPVFNAADTLGECIASLDRQTLKEFEVVAVDDGSTDATGEILDEWRRRDGRVEVVTRPHEGLVAALNAGLAECRSDLIARMDADDIAHPLRFERQLQLLEERADVDVVSCLVRHFPTRNVAEGFRLYEAWINALADHETMARERFVESPVAHPSVVFRRTCVEAVGGYRDHGWPEDYDLWLRLFADGRRFAKVDATLLFWRERFERLSRTDPRYSSDAFLRCKAHHFVRGPANGGRPVICWGAGPNGRRFRRHLEQKGVAVRAFIDIDPAKIGRAAGGVPIVGPGDLGRWLDDEALVVAAVASRGARSLIRRRLIAAGLAEGRDFWCVL